MTTHATDLLSIRGYEPKGDYPAWWYCKNCGERHVAVRQPKVCVCGGETFFRNCNLMLSGDTARHQKRAYHEWYARWANRKRPSLGISESRLGVARRVPHNAPDEATSIGGKSQ